MIRPSLLLLSLILSTAACECDDNPPIAFGNAGVGEACRADGDCRTSLGCDSTAGTCQPRGDTPEGGSCELSGDCEANLYCGPLRTCAPAGDGMEGADCTTTGECEAGLLCVTEGFGGRCRSAGEGDLRDPCGTDADCLAGLSCSAQTGGVSVCDSPLATDPGDGGVGLRPPPLWAGEDCTAATEEGTAEALFRVPRAGSDFDFYSLPYPNDVRRTATGLDLSGHPSPDTALSIDVVDRYLRASEEDLDGFSVNPTIYFRFSEPYDWDSMEDRFIVVDVTEGSPTYGQPVNVSWFFSFGRVSKYICESWFALRTGHGRPLSPGTTYAAILKTGIVTGGEGGGATMTRSGDLDAIIGDTSPSDAALSTAWTKYAPLRSWLGDPLNEIVSQAEILNVTVFTTQNTERVVPRLREVIRGRAEPTVSDLTLCDGSTPSPCDDGTEQRACGAVDAAFHELHGRVELPIFQEGTAPYETPEDGGGIAVDGDGTPIVARTENVCFALTVPKVAPPAEGFPVILVGHGTGGSFTGAARSGLAAAAATADHEGTVVPSATLAIDLPQHGERRGGSSRDPDRLFFNFANPRAARDNVVQGAADLFSLVYFTEGYLLDAASSPTTESISFDSTRVTMYMHSQGATHAALMLPYETGVQAVVLSGNGGDLTQSLLHKTEPVDIAGILPYALLDITPSRELPTGSYHPALSIFQAYFDAADPVNFARRLTVDRPAGGPARHVLMTYGLGDSFSPEATMRAYSVAARLRLVRPLLGDSWGLAEEDPPVMGNIAVDMMPFTMGLRQYDPTSAMVDGHFVAFGTPEGRADVTRFLTGALAGAVPTIGE